MVVTCSRRDYWQPTPPIRGIGGCNIHDRHPASGGVSRQHAIDLYITANYRHPQPKRGKHCFFTKRSRHHHYSPRREKIFSAVGSIPLRGGKHSSPRWEEVLCSATWRILTEKSFFLRHSIDGILQFARFFINSRQMYAL